MKKRLLYLGTLLLLCGSLGGCKSQTQKDSEDIPTTIQGLSVSDGQEKNQVEPDAVSFVNKQEDSQADQETEAVVSEDRQEEHQEGQRVKDAKEEKIVEQGIFQEYKQDALGPYLNDMGQEYIGCACSLTDAKDHIESFLGYWTLGFDNDTWWEDTCNITDTAINGLEYRVDTLYYYSDDRADYYMMGFHYVEDIGTKYIVELIDIRETETEEAMVGLYDVVSHLSSPIAGYDCCYFEYENKFANEEEFALAKEAEEENAVAYDEMMESDCTKEEVYLKAQEDLKDGIYGEANFYNIFDIIGMAATISWEFQPVDAISYWFDNTARRHELTFIVTLSEYQGLGGSVSYQMSMSYIEDDDGGLMLDGVNGSQI